MQRRRVRGVADAVAQHEDALRVVERQQRHVRHRAHVALRQQLGRGHRMTVGHEHTATVRTVGDGNELGDPFANRVGALRRKEQRARQEIVGWKQQPCGERDGSKQQRTGDGPAKARLHSRGRVRLQADKQRNDRERRRRHQHRGAPLHAEERQQYEAGGQSHRTPPRTCSRGREVPRAFQPLPRAGRSHSPAETRSPSASAGIAATRRIGRSVEPELCELAVDA